MLWHQVLPASSGGIITGVILALSRAIGETAPLIVVGALAYVAYPPLSPTDSYSVLPIQLFNWVGRPQKEFEAASAAAIIVLLCLVFVLNGLAVYLRNRAQNRVKW
jgi:phosphate transport system permease protein